MKELLALVLFSMLPMASSGGAVSSVITANVNVVSCPFRVSVGLLPAYAKFDTISSNYSVVALLPCTIPDLRGNFVVTDQANRSVVYTEQLDAGSVDQTAKTVPFSFNTVSLTNTTYLGAVVLTVNSYSNSSSADFRLLNLANVTVTNLSTSSSINTGAPVTLSVKLLNNGQLSATSVLLNISITGAYASNQLDSVGPLSPQQSENLSVQLTGVAPNQGAYNATVFASYSANGIAKTSRSRSVAFTASNASTTSTSAGASHPKPITPIVGVTTTEMPLSASSLVGLGLPAFYLFC